MVRIIKATNLPVSDTVMMGGSSDPYVIVKSTRPGAQKWKTSTIDKNLNPVWNETLDIQDYEQGDGLIFEVWDEDPWPKPHDLLGKFQLASAYFEEGGLREAQYPLEDTPPDHKKQSYLYFSIDLEEVRPGDRRSNNRISRQSSSDQRDASYAHRGAFQGMSGSGSLANQPSYAMGGSMRQMSPSSRQVTETGSRQNLGAVQQLFHRLSQEIEENKPQNCIHFIVDFLCKHYPEHLHGFASLWQCDPDLQTERHEVVDFFKVHLIPTAVAAHFANAGYDTLDTLATLSTDSLVDVEAFNNVKWLPGHKVRLQQIFEGIAARVRAYRKEKRGGGIPMATAVIGSPRATQPLQLAFAQQLQQQQLVQQQLAQPSMLMLGAPQGRGQALQPGVYVQPPGMLPPVGSGNIAYLPGQSPTGTAPGQVPFYPQMWR